MSAAAEAAAGTEAAPPGPSKLPMLLALLNTVALLGAGGLLVFTKLVFKRPPITESQERSRLEKLAAAQAAHLIPGQISFEPVTINILPTQLNPQSAQEAPGSLPVRNHFVTVGFSLELRDGSRKDEVEELRPVILDRLLGALSRKRFNELSSVQGRYVLRNQLMEIVNRAAAGVAEDEKHPYLSDGLVTNVYFTTFLVQ